MIVAIIHNNLLPVDLLMVTIRVDGPKQAFLLNDLEFIPDYCIGDISALLIGTLTFNENSTRDPFNSNNRYVAFTDYVSCAFTCIALVINEVPVVTFILENPLAGYYTNRKDFIEGIAYRKFDIPAKDDESSPTSQYEYCTMLNDFLRKWAGFEYDFN